MHTINRFPPKITFTRLLTFGAAGVLPIILLALNYALIGIYPFGSKTILISDLSGQYVDYYSALYALLTINQNLFYCWEAGMGLNFIGLYAYYLSSPFSLLILLFPQEDLPHALTLITWLKVGSAGLTFSIYAHAIISKPPRLAKELDCYTNRVSAAIIVSLAVFYALSAYVVVYSFNLMWLDGVILLPLVLLAIERLLEAQRFLPLYLTLVVLFAANFYIAYMVGFFALLYFVIRFFTAHPAPCCKNFLWSFGLFLGAALAAAGSLAFFLVPTFIALQNSSGDPFNFSALTSFKPNFPLQSLASKLPLGAYDSLSNSGLPNIYSGLLALLLAPLFFFIPSNSYPTGSPTRPVNRSRYREAFLYGLLSLLFICSFYFSNFNLVWHAFDTPNSFPYRYSFLFTFLTLFLSLQAFMRLTEVRIKSGLIGLIWGLWTAVFLGLSHAAIPFLYPSLLVISLMFLTVYTILLVFINKFPAKRSWLALLLLGAVIVEAGVNTGATLQRLDAAYSYVSENKYSERLSPLAELLGDIPKTDTFYRTERTLGRSYNDPMNLNYPGITHFSSLANTELHEFLRRLGFAVSPNAMWVNYAGATPVTDSLLGVKYVISPIEKPTPHLDAYRELSRRQGYVLYQNPWALPLAFITDRSLLAWNQENNSAFFNPFTLQNEFLNRALGKEGAEYFTKLPVTAIRLHNLTAVTAADRITYSKLDPHQEGVLEFVISPQTPHPIFAYLHADLTQVSVYAGDQYLGPYLDVYNRKILALGAGNPAANSEVSIKLVLEEPSLTLYAYHFYEFNQELFAEAIAKLRSQSPDFLVVHGNTVRLQVHAGEAGARLPFEKLPTGYAPGQTNGEATEEAIDGAAPSGSGNTLLFTTIPYDPGWEATANGQPLALRKVAGAFIGIDLPPGEHDIVLRFIPSGFRAGLWISGGTVAILLGCCFYRQVRRRRTQESVSNSR